MGLSRREGTTAADQSAHCRQVKATSLTSAVTFGRHTDSERQPGRRVQRHFTPGCGTDTGYCHLSVCVVHRSTSHSLVKGWKMFEGSGILEGEQLKSGGIGATNTQYTPPVCHELACGR